MYRVFIAGSDERERKAVRHALAGAADRFEVVGEATDGEFALPMISDLRPDVLVTYEGMPFMDAMELSRRVRRRYPWIEMVLLSGSDNAGHGEEAKKIGVGEYLLKPVSAYELRDAVERAACRLRRTAKALEDSIRWADRIVPPERREQERRMQRWLETGSGDDGVAWPREGRYCRLLTLAGVSGRAADAARGVLRFMEATRGDRRAFVLELPWGPTMVVAEDDEESLESLAYEAAHTALCAVEKFAGARVKIQISRSAETPEELRASWLDMQKLAKVQTGNRPILSEEDLNSPMESVREYLGEHMMDPYLAHRHAARSAGMTINRFSVVFAQEMGATFTQYAFQARVSAAKGMLKNTKMRVGSVASAVGFDDVTYFSRIFELVTGLTPQKYRKKHAADAPQE
ncbi:MAG: helix-turn-helix domain-containing protein [Clostridia bacterium]|nr:helix-turn-helix domain-containing protein [Clostridia bacterium]